MSASDRLEPLPPIDVLRTPDGYWVTDGHNRVAVAKANGQVDVDADVRAVVLPGQGPVRPEGPLAPVLVDSAGLQATRRATRPRVPKAAPSGRPPAAERGAAAADGAAADDGAAAEAPTDRGTT